MIDRGDDGDRDGHGVGERVAVEALVDHHARLVGRQREDEREQRAAGEVDPDLVDGGQLRVHGSPSFAIARSTSAVTAMVATTLTTSAATTASACDPDVRPEHHHADRRGDEEEPQVLAERGGDEVDRGRDAAAHAQPREHQHEPDDGAGDERQEEPRDDFPEALEEEDLDEPGDHAASLARGPPVVIGVAGWLSCW